MKRFMTLSEVAETLSISMSQAYALVRSGDLPAIQIGGRNQWRVEITKLEEYIGLAYLRSQETVNADTSVVGDVDPSVGGDVDPMP